MIAYERLSHFYDSDWGTWPASYVHFVEKYSSGSSPLDICDLACGTGTLARLLADKGHRIHCVDLSEAMLAVASGKFSDGEPVTFQHADMSSVTLSGEFDIITCTYDSINYLTTPEQMRGFFTNTAKALKDSGRLIFDCNTENLYLHRHKGAYQREIDGESFVQRCRYDADKKAAITMFEFSSGTETHTQRPYSFLELQSILQEKGLRVVEVFSGFEEQEYTDDCERFICVVEKPYDGIDSSTQRG